MLDLGKVCDMIELYAESAGVTRINRVLAREVINMKLREFVRETGILTSKWTLSSVANQYEYQLPTGIYHVEKCNFDDYEAYKTTFEAKDELAGNVS